MACRCWFRVRGGGPDLDRNPNRDSSACGRRRPCLRAGWNQCSGDADGSEVARQLAATDTRRADDHARIPSSSHRGGGRHHRRELAVRCLSSVWANRAPGHRGRWSPLHSTGAHSSHPALLRDGSLFCLVPLVTLIVSPENARLGHAPVWFVIPSWICGLAIWLTAVANLLQVFQLVREQSVTPLSA